VLILDPTNDLADTVAPLEDLLRLCDADSDSDVPVLDDAAHTVGRLVSRLREAIAARPAILAPDGRAELGPVLRSNIHPSIRLRIDHFLEDRPEPYIG